MAPLPAPPAARAAVRFLAHHPWYGLPACAIHHVLQPRFRRLSPACAFDCIHPRLPTLPSATRVAASSVGLASCPASGLRRGSNDWPFASSRLSRLAPVSCFPRAGDFNFQPCRCSIRRRCCRANLPALVGLLHPSAVPAVQLPFDCDLIAGGTVGLAHLCGQVQKL
jgi:hypothetical protein